MMRQFFATCLFSGFGSLFHNMKMAEMRGLQVSLKSAQDRLDALRRMHPELKLISDEADHEREGF